MKKRLRLKGGSYMFFSPLIFVLQQLRLHQAVINSTLGVFLRQTILKGVLLKILKKEKDTIMTLFFRFF